MLPQKKIVYIISNINKSLAFEWITSGLKSDYRLCFVLLNPSSSLLEEFLLLNNVEVKRVRYRGKKDFVSAFFKVYFYLILKRPHVVHAHLFDAQLIGLTAAWAAFVRKRIYTRHNSTYHHIYHPHGVRFDYWSNKMATHIISISQATDETLIRLERVSPAKIVKIPHGFVIDVFTNVDKERAKLIRAKWGISELQPVIGVIARHIEWKGIQFIIPAFRRFLEEHSNATLVLANAGGPYHQAIMKLIETIPHGRVIIIPFEEDVAALYAIFDLYVHTPIDPLCEAFGQTYVEALAAGVPSIFTLSGIAVEFVKHRENAWVVKFSDSESIYQALVDLWNDSELRSQLVKNGKQDVLSRFKVEVMVAALKRLYDS